MASLKNAPEFETMTETNTGAPMQTETKPADASAVAAASAAASTAIAKAASTAVTTPSAKFQVAFSQLNNVFDTATVEGLALATPRVKGEQGSLFQGDEDLGSAIQFEIVSFNHRWTIGTGENDAEAKDFFKVSYDNQTLSGSGESVTEYVEGLKAQGFSKASVSPYLDIFGFVTWSEKKGSIPIESRELVCLQCSKTSMGAFTAFATTQGLLQSKGIAAPTDVVEVHAEKRTSGSNKYTNFSFHRPSVK